MALFTNYNSFAKNFFDPMGLGYMGGKKKKQNSYGSISPTPYNGARPYTAADVGLDSSRLKSINDQYIPQIMERSRGEGLVGYDPRRRELLRQEFLADLGESRAADERTASARASGQGLRGGIPLTIGNEIAKQYGRNRTAGLNEIDINDLEARREDINRATYAQPEAVSQGAGIQQNRANFDLAEWQGSQPTYIDETQDSILPALLAAAGTIGGAYLGGPMGASLGNQAAQTIGGTMANRSLSRYSQPYYSSGDLGRQFRASMRTY